MRLFSVAALLLVWGLVLNIDIIRPAYGSANLAPGPDYNQPRAIPIVRPVEAALSIADFHDSVHRLGSSDGVVSTGGSGVASEQFFERRFLTQSRSPTSQARSVVISPPERGVESPWRRDGDGIDSARRDGDEEVEIVSGAVVALVFGLLGYVVVARRATTSGD